MLWPFVFAVPPMATCIRCGSELLPGETQCGRCGTSHVASDHPTPLGVWASGSNHPPEGAELHRHDLPRPAPGRERTPIPGQAPRRRRHTGSAATPLPRAATASALAMADAEQPSIESTGTHPTVTPDAEVVPLHSQPAAGQATKGEAATDVGAPGTPPPVQNEATVSGERTVVAAPPRPPVLASESLREDMEPTEPWRRTVRIGGTALALLGAILALAVGGVDPTVLTLAVVLLSAGGLCAGARRYAVRAVSVLAIAGGGLAVATVARQLHGAPVEAPVLAVGTVVLAGGLLFRSAYRASHLARTMVAVGMLGIAVALLMADSVGEFATIGASWQSWLHVTTSVGFGILLFLSLLAFMAPSTTGGTQVWGTALLVWYALHVTLTVVTRFFPPAGQGPAATLPDPAMGVVVGAAACAVLAAVALAQALAVSAGCTVEQRSSVG